MKPLPEEISYYISNISYNPFFYLINGVYNKGNFDKLLSRNYTFPSLLRILIHSGEKKILKQLVMDYEEVIKSLPISIQNDIDYLLLPSSTSLKKSFIKNKPDNHFIPCLKIFSANDLNHKKFFNLIKNQLITGEYTYIQDESEMEKLVSFVIEKFNDIKRTISDSNGSIPSPTEKKENFEYSFIYLYALISSINFPLKWNKILLEYNPSFIKVKVSEKDLEFFKWFNNSFQCQNIETIKHTYFILKDIYHECRLPIENKEYMNFIFDHPQYEPIILDTINNLPLTTWNILHPNKIDYNNSECNYSNNYYKYFNNDNDNNNKGKFIENYERNKNSKEEKYDVIDNYQNELQLPQDQHNILYILTHNFFLGSYPSCHLLYLYDEYIEDIFRFYDEDNNQIFKYYSDISSNPDHTLISLFNYTSIILFLRSPHIKCLFTDPELELKAKKEREKERLSKIQPAIINTLFDSDKKLILVTSPFSSKTFDIEQFLPHLSPSSISSNSTIIDENNSNHENSDEIISPLSEMSSVTISSNTTATLNNNINNNNNNDIEKKSIEIEKEEEDEEFKNIKNEFKYYIHSQEDPISYFNVNMENFNNSISNFYDQSNFNYNLKYSLSDNYSVSLSIKNEIYDKKYKNSLKNITIFIKNNLLSFTSQPKEWSIKRSRFLVNYETYYNSVHHQDEISYYNETKTSNMLNHLYDEDWYIHFCLPNKKIKGVPDARIYLY